MAGMPDTFKKKVLDYISGQVVGPTATVSNRARSGSTVTLTTSAAHGLQVGETIIVSGIPTDTSLNTPAGLVDTVATVPSTTTFTYTCATSGTVTSTASTGTVTPARAAYMMLLTSVPADTDVSLTTLAGYEVAATGYSRQPIGWDVATTAIAGGAANTANLATVLFGPFTSPSGLAAATGAAFVTAGSGTSGQVIWVYEFGSTLSALQGEAVAATAGNIGLSYTG